jgi:hypothetical protein
MPITKKKKMDPEVASALLTLTNRLDRMEKNHKLLKEQTHPAPFYPGEFVKFGNKQAIVEECTPKIAKIRILVDFRSYPYMPEYHFVDPKLLNHAD